MDQQQYTIQILDRDESTDLVTSKQSCLIGRSLISDIRIHLPSVKEMHLEIDMKNKRVTSYGSDVKVNDVEVEVNGTVDYEYGDIISLRNKKFVVHKNKEHREGKSLPLVVSADRAFGEQVQPSETPLKGRFNMSPSKPRRSEEAGPVLSEAAEDAETVHDAGSRGAREQNTMHEEEEAQPREDSEKNARPSFFNATDSSIDNIIAREKELVDSEIKNNIEFDVGVLQTSVSAKKTKPMDLKEAVLEKTVLEDIMEGKQDTADVERTVRGLADKGEMPREVAREVVISLEEETANESRDNDGGEDVANTTENMPSDMIKIRREVVLVTEKTVCALKDAQTESVADITETPTEKTESKVDAAPQPSEEVLRADYLDEAPGELEGKRADAPAMDTDVHAEYSGVCSDGQPPTSRQAGLEEVENEESASEGSAEDKDVVLEESPKRGNVNNNLPERPPKEESEMAGAKYGSASRKVENLVDSLNKEEERRANMGVLAKKTKPTDSTSARNEASQKKMTGDHRKEEEPSGKEKKPSHIEAGAAKKPERSPPRKKADAKKKESSTGQKSKERETADGPFKKKIRLASAASSQQDAGVAQKSRRKAAVPEKAPKDKKTTQQATSKKEAPKKKASVTARRKKVDESEEKKKMKKTKTPRK